jgi:hypothetical protein
MPFAFLPLLHGSLSVLQTLFILPRKRGFIHTACSSPATFYGSPAYSATALFSPDEGKRSKCWRPVVLAELLPAGLLHTRLRLGAQVDCKPFREGLHYLQPLLSDTRSRLFFPPGTAKRICKMYGCLTKPACSKMYGCLTKLACSKMYVCITNTRILPSSRCPFVSQILKSLDSRGTASLAGGTTAIP